MFKRTASDIMEKNFVTATPETSAFDLVNMFVKNHITAIPIINENDVVAVDEYKIGDNDTLSATAFPWKAEFSQTGCVQ